MILSDKNIKEALQKGAIKIDPAPNFEEQLGACSVDLKLGDTFRVFNHSTIPFIDPRKKHDEESLMTEITVKDGEPFIMQPGDFVLAVTQETITIADNLMGRIEGRSSLGRLAIIVHSTAATFDPGWHGKATMEVGNLGRIPVALYPGMRICAFVFEELKSSAEVPYKKKKSAKYVNQDGPLASRIDKEWK